MYDNQDTQMRLGIQTVKLYLQQGYNQLVSKLYTPVTAVL